MKKWMLLTVMLGAVQLSMMAQDDDMYFVPTKANVAKQKAAYGIPTDTYYSGSSRSVDEYNRRGSSYEVLPTDTGDVISFSAVEGVYPDSLGDFALTRQMQRWDGYEPSEAYWAGYNQGRNDSWGYAWHSPWWYTSYYPWYDYGWGWYDPWYYGSWYGGWYDPWYYGSWGWGGYYSHWYHPSWYYGWYGGGYRGGHYAGYRNGTQNHGHIVAGAPAGITSRDGRTRTFANGTFGGSRAVRNGSFGTGTRSSSSGINTRRSASGGTVSNSYGNFGGSRSASSSSSSSAPSRSYSSGSSSSSGGGGSFGGSRSSGGSVGGSRSGGGSFGGGRR